MNIAKAARFFARPQALASLLAALTVACAASAAFAQDVYPSKPIKLVNNFPPGGPADILARSVGAVLADTLKQPVIVDNRSGAAGNIGADAVAKSPADGYTLLVSIDTTFTINPHLYASMPFKLNDLKPVIVMASSGLLLATNPSTGIKTFGDLLSKGRGKSLNFSSAGNGSPGHLASAMLGNSTPVKTTHVPYRGNTPAVTAMLAGEVDAGILATPGLIPYVQTGKLNAVAVTSPKRSRLAPQLPTVAELGLKSLEQEVLYIVMAPAGTPDAVVQLLQKSIADALKRPDAQTRLASLDLFYEGQTGAAASKRLADMSARYGTIVRATGMTAQ